MRKLTAKQEAFAQAIADGFGPSQAYIKCYDWNGSATVVSVKAQEVLKSPLVANRIEALRAQHARKQYLTRERKREILANIADATDSKRMERIKAIEVDNVMTGDNAPQKVDVFGLSELLGLVRSKSK